MLIFQTVRSARLEIFMAVKNLIGLFWVMTPFIEVVGCR
jgi:hypothetical protein